MASIKRLSNITYIPVVEHISRKFALRKETVSLKQFRGDPLVSVQMSTGYMGAGVRRKVVDGGTMLTNYLFLRKNPRTSAISAAEIQARIDFTACQQWVKEAQEDLGAITDNQIKYHECRYNGRTIQGVSAKDYMMRGFMFAVAMKIRKSGGTLPADHNLPAYDA